jgi:hypothetical protein
MFASITPRNAFSIINALIDKMVRARRLHRPNFAGDSLAVLLRDLFSLCSMSSFTAAASRRFLLALFVERSSTSRSGGWHRHVQALNVHTKKTPAVSCGGFL